MSTDTKQRRKRRSFTAEFKVEAVRLVLEEGKTVGQVARDLDLTETALRTWVERRARADRGQGKAGALTTAEREELARLRKENRQLQMERDFLKKLHRQIWPELLFDASEVAVRVCAEAPAHDARDAPLFQLSAQRPPGVEVSRCQVGAVERWEQLGCSDGGQPDPTAHDEAGAPAHPARGSPLVVATSAEEVFQVIVGARQLRHVVAVEEALPVATRFEQEVSECLTQDALMTSACPAHHGGQQRGEPASHSCGVQARLVLEDGCSAFHPPVGPRKGGPTRGSGPECVAQHRVQAAQFWWAGPPFDTRSRLF
ncbi:transposase, partial [Myxococcus sp. AS-1-15]|uniref:transposase n=1 Tax=Myxococcus sp. AS-1-15 TaxID=2874600 RepID=UPI001CC05132